VGCRPLTKAPNIHSGAALAQRPGIGNSTQNGGDVRVFAFLADDAS
jgi:hypothetical protein